MKSLDKVIKKLTPLVKSYAIDMNVLIVEDQSANLDFYKVVFGKYFNICDVALNGQEALDMWNNNRDYYDLIITDVHMPIMDGLELIKRIREESMEQSIIVITDTTDIEENQNLAYYFIDGLLPKPIDKQKLFILLYRVLKKIAEKKEFSHYINELEKQLNETTEFKSHFNFIMEKLQPIHEQEEVRDVIALLSTLIGKTDVIIQEQKSKVVLSEDNEKDLRFSTADHQLSALELMEQLDDTVVDKIENFLDVLDTYLVDVDAIEKQSPKEAIVSLQKISIYFNEFIDIINNMVIFPIVSRAFTNLNTFIHNIKEEELVDFDKKSLLVSLLLNVEKDVSGWIKMIFVEQKASNIYYFDASFSNSSLEIESMFNNFGVESSEYFDDDDLGFF
ncbi:MAG: CheY-like chemotaxis protein [Sulfurimonas sp.]|jgi:CheY-like chemotaxis protein|uniref:response regulator n=1 Tax=Sulfurimonas sp. TaxID=2022749 RepID=UPI0039E514FA